MSAASEKTAVTVYGCDQGRVTPTWATMNPIAASEIARYAMSIGRFHRLRISGPQEGHQHRASPAEQTAVTGLGRIAVVARTRSRLGRDADDADAEDRT